SGGTPAGSCAEAVGDEMRTSDSLDAAESRRTGFSLDLACREEMQEGLADRPARREEPGIPVTELGAGSPSAVPQPGEADLQSPHRPPEEVGAEDHSTSRKQVAPDAMQRFDPPLAAGDEGVDVGCHEDSAEPAAGQIDHHHVGLEQINIEPSRP